jgi:hypothetical protein
MRGFDVCSMKKCKNKKWSTQHPNYSVRAHILLDHTNDIHVALIQEIHPGFHPETPCPFCFEHFDKDTQDFFLEHGYLSDEPKWNRQTMIYQSADVIQKPQRINTKKFAEVNFFDYNQNVLKQSFKAFKKNDCKNNFSKVLDFAPKLLPSNQADVVEISNSDQKTNAKKRKNKKQPTIKHPAKKQKKDVMEEMVASISLGSEATKDFDLADLDGVKKSKFSKIEKMQLQQIAKLKSDKKN